MRRLVLPVRLDGITEYVLTGDEHHYLSRVLRLRPGDSFSACDAAGATATCTINSISRDSCSLDIRYAGECDGDADAEASGPRITLYQALVKGRKLERIIRQATECGVEAIVPMRTRFSVADVPDDRVAHRLDRWRRIVREAIQQSGNRFAPTLSTPIDIDEVPLLWSARGPALVFHQNGLDAFGFLDTLSGTFEEVAVCVGPEGGFADEEIEHLVAHGFTPAFLGARVLRSETAALYAIAAVQVTHQVTQRAIERAIKP